ncbi:hypothetical protein [Pseudomonas umsongensis]
MISDLPPYKGELFSCWLYRQSLFSKYTPLNTFLLEEIYWGFASQASFDADFDIMSDFVLQACSILNISRSEFAYFFSANTWLVPRAFRICFCYHCFCDHIKEVGHPTCKVTWATVYMTVCPDHACALLESTFKKTKVLNLGINYFKNYYIDGVRELLESGGLAAIPDMLMPVILKIQSHLDGAEAMSKASENQRAVGYWEFCKTVLRIFLFPVFGLVHVTGRFGTFPNFSGQVSFLRALFNGPLTANLQHRRIAIMLLGRVLGLIKNEDYSCFVDFLQRKCTWRLNDFDPYEIGRLANVFSQNNAEFVNQIIKRQAKYISCPSIDAFVSGFLSRANIE